MSKHFPTFCSQSGETAIIAAAKADNVLVVKLLLENDANANVSDDVSIIVQSVQVSDGMIF